MQRVKRLICLVRGHRFGWRRRTKRDDVGTCARCGVVRHRPSRLAETA